MRNEPIFIGGPFHGEIVPLKYRERLVINMTECEYEEPLKRFDKTTPFPPVGARTKHQYKIETFTMRDIQYMIYVWDGMVE